MRAVVPMGPATPGLLGSETRSPAFSPSWYLGNLALLGCLQLSQPALREGPSESRIQSSQGAQGWVVEMVTGGALESCRCLPCLTSGWHRAPTSRATHTKGGCWATTQGSVGPTGPEGAASSSGVTASSAAGVGGGGMPVGGSRVCRLWGSTGGTRVSDSTLSVSAVSSHSREMLGCWAGVRLGDRLAVSTSRLLAGLLLGLASASVSLRITSWSGRLG